MFNISPELFRVCPVVLFWNMFNGDDLFYVIPVGLSHLSLDKLFNFFELVDIVLMVGFVLSFIHPVSPSNHLFDLFCYPREFVLRFGNFLRYVVVYALLEFVGESVPQLVYVGSY